MRRRRPKGDALDRLEYEDRALLELMRILGDESRDRRERGAVVGLLVEHLAVREAARELVAERLVKVDEVRDQAERLAAGTVEGRAELVCVEELGRGKQATNLDQGREIDAAVAEILPGLRRHIGADLGEIVPEIRRRLSAEERAKVLPTARFVVRHAPTHPGVHRRRWYGRIGPLVRAHALYDFLRDLPRRGAKPSAEAEISERDTTRVP